jgi:hypothetical protein
MRPLVPFTFALISVPCIALGQTNSRGMAIAEMTSPGSVGEVIDASYTFRWNDQDEAVASSEATADFFYTQKMPPPFAPGTLPAELEGTPIVRDVLVWDKTNAYSWDTRTVPSGSYFIWSVVREPDPRAVKQRIVSFSPGVVTVAHPGDPIAPAVVVVQPPDPFHWPASNEMHIGYRAFDPDGTATVRIEAGRWSDGNMTMNVLASGLPAVGEGVFKWDTTNVEEGDQVVRASIEDRRGLEFSAFDRYFRFINHPDPAAAKDDGCTSVRLRSDTPAWQWCVLVLGVAILARRKHARAGLR